MVFVVLELPEQEHGLVDDDARDVVAVVPLLLLPPLDGQLDELLARLGLRLGDRIMIEAGLFKSESP